MELTPHTFHIPVMGLAYTADSPIKVARFGISSVISIIEDRLIELMRKYYCASLQEPYHPITIHEKDFRARRITEYLNLVNKIVREQVKKMKASAFLAGSDLVKYFEMLPSESTLRDIYFKMVNSNDEFEKNELESQLKDQIIPGAIDVNIMTKLDRNQLDANGAQVEDGSDAVAALRGYALSDLTNSSIIFSAGMNPRLFSYLEKFNVFDATGWGEFGKKVVIKVSDYRSALIQGKMLAKKGIWVSEFRVESGLNCGGHAFATDGYLMGPIMAEFNNNREELAATLHAIYNAAARVKGKPVFDTPHPIKLTVQGGIGTHEEDHFLHEHYGAESTGWGTPFLLCPEATTVDDGTLQLLAQANASNLSLSRNSPLGIRFHYLKGTTSANEKLNRILSGKPGSPCTEKYLASNTEFTDEPICTASHKYQALKIAQLKTQNLPGVEYEKEIETVLARECLCIGLSNSASIKYNQPFVSRLHSVTICPGPNIAYFSKVVSLQEMTDHIYGRINLLEAVKRPHMFINELRLYVGYLKDQVSEAGLDEKRIQYCNKFATNLTEGISYYRSIGEKIENTGPFLHELQEAETEIEKLVGVVC